jgi:type I restriction enzyme, S subunit
MRELPKAQVGTSTQADALPDDWSFREIRSFASIGTGAKNTQDRSTFGKYPFFVRSQNVERIDSWSFDGEAVLTAGDGVGTGKVFHYINGRFDYHQRVYRISNFDQNVSGKYFFYQFSQNFLARIESLTARSSVDSVRMETIAGMKIALPERAEQNRIAGAIDDADQLVTILDALIAKKQAIKQGMMQQLLTGKTRLPGYTHAWQTRQLGELVTIRSGRPKPRAAGGRYWIVDMGSVTRDGLFAVTRRTDSSDDILRIGDLVMPKDDIGGGNIIGRSGYIDKKRTYALADHVYALTPIRDDSLFLNYAINSYEVNRSLRSQATGSAQLGLSKRSVLRQELRLPPIDEQRAIATVLAEADAENAILHEQLDKAKAVKQGMIQELLTGRARLRVTEVIL